MQEIVNNIIEDNEYEYQRVGCIRKMVISEEGSGKGRYTNDLYPRD